MNFISTFDELNKLYEEDTHKTVSENFDNENGVTAWNKVVIDYYTQAAKELGLADYTMKSVGFGDNAKVVITAVKNGEKLTAEASEDQTHDIESVEDAKGFIQFVLPELTESIVESEDPDTTDATEISDDTLIEEPRQVICECDKCGALVIKDEADIVVDEETDLVNVEDECQFCEEAKGFKIVGVVAPYEAAIDEEPIEEVVEESLNNSELLKEIEKTNELKTEHESEYLTLNEEADIIDEDLADVARKVFDKPASTKTQQAWEDELNGECGEISDKRRAHLEKKFAQQRDWEARHEADAE